MDCECEEKFKSCLRNVPKMRIKQASQGSNSTTQTVGSSIIAEAILSSLVSTSYFDVMPVVSRSIGDDPEEKKPHHTKCIRWAKSEEFDDENKWVLEDLEFITKKENQKSTKK